MRHPVHSIVVVFLNQRYITIPMVTVFYPLVLLAILLQSANVACEPKTIFAA